ncbi:MAG: LacI family transcriptional regulator [Verrucomicrobia bacterium]|nr:MAG: LacI family transcriptional regulator [Verrucomicrobiota bacterium]
MNTGKKRITLEDVGKFCGVSRSTVSRVINKSPLVNEETRRRVELAIKTLGYVPDFSARSLMTRRTETIAISLPDIRGGFYPEVLGGADEEAVRRGYLLLVVFQGSRRPRSHSLQRIISYGRVDGALVFGDTVPDQQLRLLSESHVRVVRLAAPSPIPEIGSIVIDNFGGALAAVRHLSQRGCRRIAFISGPPGNRDAEERRRGYQQGLQECGLQFDESLVAEGGFVRQGGAAAARTLIDRGVDFDGLFVANDEMAIGAVETLLQAGITIPQQVCVVGFDDIELARFVGLTTVHVPVREIGMHGARLLCEMIEQGRQPETITMPTRIIERVSTARGGSLSLVRPGGD